MVIFKRALVSFVCLAISANVAFAAAAEDKIFETDRLVVSKLKREDVGFVAKLFSQKEVAVPSGLDAMTPGQAQHFATSMLRYTDATCDLVVSLKGTSEPVALFQTPDVRTFRQVLDDVHYTYHEYVYKMRAVDVGCAVDIPHWRKGYAEEVVRGLISYFQTDHKDLHSGLKAKVLTANIAPDNIPSVTLFLKCGFKLHGDALLSRYGRQLYVYELQKSSKNKLSR